MKAQEFYKAVGMTDFCNRYYALCNRFSVVDVSIFQVSQDTISNLLSLLGKTAQRDARDNSYSFDVQLNHAIRHLGFTIQKNAIVEFWWWVERIEERFGNNFAGIAFEATKLAGNQIPQPPYPRPEFHDQRELHFIVTECFQLADILDSVVKDA